MKARVSAFVVFALSLALGGCEGKKVLDKCDGFFQQGCKAPLQCVNIGDVKKCVDYCDTSFKCKTGDCCAEGFQCQKVETRIMKNGVDQNISAGTYKYCFPK